MRNKILRNGVGMPEIGFGTFMMRGAQLEESVRCAISCGYRLIDTAASYRNESEIGRAVRDSGIPREELFLTTKLWVQDAGYEQALRAFETSCKALDMDYIDLYLIHQPFGDYYGAWRAMEKLYQEGRIRAIGVSNFAPDRLVDLCLNTEIPPMVNQIERHPFYQQNDALHEMEKYGVIPQAWGPLCEAQCDIFHHPVLERIAQAHECSAAQIILKWNLQSGVAVIPRSAQKTHRIENISLDNIILTDEELAQIADLDRGHSEIIDHRCAHTARQIINMKIHA